MLHPHCACLVQGQDDHSAKLQITVQVQLSSGRFREVRCSMLTGRGHQNMTNSTRMRQHVESDTRHRACCMPVTTSVNESFASHIFLEKWGRWGSESDVKDRLGEQLRRQQRNEAEEQMRWQLL